MDMLNQALEKWSDWGLVEKPRLVRVFEDGQNHHTGLIQSADKKFVLKLFKHSFKRTIEAEYWASERCISPDLYMAANNTALYEFIEDQGYTPERLKSLAHTLKLTHQRQPESVGKFDLIGFCEGYLVAADEEIHNWHSALMPALIEFTEDPTPTTYCHNDLVAENCLFTDGSTLLIDWEFAQPNNPWFDLAAIIYYFRLNRSEAQEFLASYQPGWQKKVDQPIFFSAQIAVLWCDLLWNLHTTGKQYKDTHAERFARLSQLALQLDIRLAT
jgi:thiamine kinase-like enzyme